MSDIGKDWIEDDLSPEHYQAIGEFIEKYSSLESYFNLVLRRYADVPEEACMALVNGMKAKYVIERIKRMLKLRKIDEVIYKDIERIETDFDPLSTFRDKLVHRQWINTRSGPAIYNFSNAKSFSAIFEEKVSTQEIRKKISEVQKLALRVIAHIVSTEKYLAAPANVRRLMPAPWHDKPAPPYPHR